MNNPFESQPYSSTSQQTTQSQPQDGMSWWFRWLIKIVAVLFGLLGFILGLFVAISFSAKCFIAGVILAISSLLVLALEVPICCSFIQFIEPIAKFSEGRPHWQKVVLYMIPPVVVICLCTQIASILGSLCIVAVAGLYFMLTIGRKAPLDLMKARATSDTTTSTKATLVNNEQLPK